MERKIKFRGKNIHTGEWLYGDYHREGKTHYITKPGDFLREYAPIEFIVDGKTVGQYTGVNDINSNPIFEGDIVETFSIYLAYQQVGNYPPPNIEVEG